MSCVALPFCCVVVVALPFSASLKGLFIACIFPHGPVTAVVHLHVHVSV